MGGLFRLGMYGILAVAAFVLDMQFLKDSTIQSSRLARRQRTLRSATSAATTYAASNHDAMSQEDRESVAILIAGQCHRFVYRDQSGPLFRGNDDTPTKYAIDVYIALQCGEVVPSYVGTVDAPPYMEQLNVTDIEYWYKQRAARYVTIDVVDTTTVDAMFHDIAHQATTYVRRLETFKLEDVPCWNAEVRKFFMRHYVFGMSQECATNHPYDVYVFNREDNHYLIPLDLDDIFFSENKTKDEPFVIVDEHCEFGAYSDKMYIANHLGASIVFSSTKAEFMSWMKRFLLVGLFQKEHSYWRPYQAESFVHDTLKSIDVEKIDLVRIDFRYVKGVQCVPQQYFYCMSNMTQELAYAKNLVTCESVW